jgi:hypothetical protein
MSSITGSYGSSISNFLRTRHTAFYNGCNNLHSHQQCIRVPVLPHPCQHLLLLLALNMPILIGVRGNLSVVLICNSFYNHEVEHLVMYLLAICTSSFENSLFNSCAHFFIVVLILWGLSFLSSLWILDISPLSDK